MSVALLRLPPLTDASGPLTALFSPPEIDAYAAPRPLSHVELLPGVALAEIALPHPPLTADSLLPERFCRPPPAHAAIPCAWLPAPALTDVNDSGWFVVSVQAPFI